MGTWQLHERRTFDTGRRNCWLSETNILAKDQQRLVLRKALPWFSLLWLFSCETKTKTDQMNKIKFSANNIAWKNVKKKFSGCATDSMHRHLFTKTELIRHINKCRNSHYCIYIGAWTTCLHPTDNFSKYLYISRDFLIPANAAYKSTRSPFVRKHSLLNISFGCDI